MSGLAGVAFAPGRGVEELAAAASRLSGPNLDVRTHASPDFAVVVASRFESPGAAGSFGDLGESERYVVACEGYLTNLAALAATAGVDPGLPRARILLALCETRGEAAPARLEGGYNLAVWDRRERTLVLACCRFGQRTLYTTPAGEGLAFASELKALPPLTGRPFTLDRARVLDSFLCGTVYGSHTLCEDVRRLLPGAELRVTAGGRRESWPGFIPPERTAEPASEDEAARALDARLSEAVSRLLAVSPEPVVMMSGGTDSPLVAAYAGKIAGRVVTLTQKLPGAEDDARNAAELARAIGAEHHEIPYSPAATDLVADTELFVEVMEQPHWNQLGAALMHFSKRARDLGQTVLTGALADTLFGCSEYLDVVRAERGPRSIFHFAPRQVNEFLVRKLLPGLGGDVDAYLDRLEPHLPPAGFDRAAYGMLMVHALATGGVASQVAQRFETEALFPFLDDGVVGFSFQVPDAMKVRGTRFKLLLGRLFDARFPAGSTPRRFPYWADPVRWGYEARRLGSVLDLLDERRTLERGVYSRVAMRSMIRRFRARTVDPRWHPILWQVLQFELFCRRFIDPPPDRA